MDTDGHRSPSGNSRVATRRVAHGAVLTTAERLWYGRFRRIVRRVLRPLLTETVRLGALRGAYFPRGAAQQLGVYETDVQHLLAQQIEPGDAVWDVGANWGFFTLLACRLTGPTGRVAAIEPFPANLEVLRDVVAGNGLENVEVLDVALSDRDGTAILSFARSECATPSLVREGGDQVEVRTARADSVVRRMRAPDVVKVDVEGAEVMVLDGATDLLRSPGRPRWVIEVHSEAIEEAVRERFLVAGYRIMSSARAPRRSAYPRHIVALPQEDV